MSYYLPEVEYKTYIDREYSFRFDYPADWIFDRGGHETWHIFCARENRPNTSVCVDVDTDGDYPFLDTVLDDFISFYARNENYAFARYPTFTTVDSTPAFRCVMIRKNFPPNITSRFELLIAVKDNIKYTLALSLEKEKY